MLIGALQQALDKCTDMFAEGWEKLVVGVEASVDEDIGDEDARIATKKEMRRMIIKTKK